MMMLTEVEKRLQVDAQNLKCGRRRIRRGISAHPLVVRRSES